MEKCKSQELFLGKFNIEWLIQHLAQTSYSPKRSSTVRLLQEDVHIYGQWTFIEARTNKYSNTTHMGEYFNSAHIHVMHMFLYD